MKIDDASAYRLQGASALRKLRASNAAVPPDMMLENPDLSFLELLTSLPSGNPLPEESAPKPENVKKNEKESASETRTADNIRPLPVTPEQRNTEDIARSETLDRLEEADILKSFDLTPTDVDYLKQSVIPNLPILMGSVPFQNVFPTTPDGEISYRGFDVSPELSELIAHGYKTGRPIRVEMDDHSAMVLTIRNGRVSAEFVSTEQGAVLAMQQELNELRQKMTARNMPVGTLESRHQPDHFREGRRNNNQPDESDS